MHTLEGSAFIQVLRQYLLILSSILLCMHLCTLGQGEAYVEH